MAAYQMLCFHCMARLNQPDQICPECGHDNRNRSNDQGYLPACVLEGQYVVGRMLGEGGFGVTYLGFDINLNCKIAIKEYYPKELCFRDQSNGAAMRPYVTKTEEFMRGRERALQEGRMVAGLETTANIVQVFNVFACNETVYTVMKYVPGKTLAQTVRENGRMNWRIAYNVIRPIMNTLSVIHSQNVIHRDISPDNIIINSRTREPVLLDFGAAHTYQGVNGHTYSLRPGYAPAEQYSGITNQDGRTDEYALCATMYFMLTARAPMDAMQRAYSGMDMASPRSAAPDMPAAFERVLLKGMSINPNDRYPSMDALMEAFDEVCNPTSASKPSESSASHQSRWWEKAEETPSTKPKWWETAKETVSEADKAKWQGLSQTARSAPQQLPTETADTPAAQQQWLHTITADPTTAQQHLPTETADTPAAQQQWLHTITADPTTAQQQLPTETADTPAAQQQWLHTITADPTTAQQQLPTETADTPAAQQQWLHTITADPNAAQQQLPTETADTPAVKSNWWETAADTASASEQLPTETADTFTPAEQPASVESTPPLSLMDRLRDVEWKKKKLSPKMIVLIRILGAILLTFMVIVFIPINVKNISKGQIYSVTFVDTLEDMPIGATKMARGKNGPVMAWAVRRNFWDIWGIWHDYEEYDVTVGAEGGIVFPSDCSNLFDGLSALRTIDFNGAVDTSSVTSMSSMFSGCSSLTTLDMTSFNTSKVTYMYSMFSDCRSLTTLDLTSFDTSNVTTMRWMFSDCRSLTTLDLTSFDTSRVTYMNYMFSGCSSLRTVTVSNSFEVAWGDDGMFDNCGTDRLTYR